MKDLILKVKRRVNEVRAVTGSHALRPALIIALLAGSVCMVVGARAYNRIVLDVPSGPAEPIPTKTIQPMLAPARPQGSPPKATTEVEVITILPTGLYPAEITRPKGLFLLAVENRSGLKAIQLRVDGEAGNRVHTGQIHPLKHYWHQGVDLPPGRYTLSEANHPDWKCTIKVVD